MPVSKDSDEIQQLVNKQLSELNEFLSYTKKLKAELDKQAEIVENLDAISVELKKKIYAAKNRIEILLSEIEHAQKFKP